jgi:hypothetical protein
VTFKSVEQKERRDLLTSCICIPNRFSNRGSNRDINLVDMQIPASYNAYPVPVTARCAFISADPLLLYLSTLDTVCIYYSSPLCSLIPQENKSRNTKTPYPPSFSMPLYRTRLNLRHPIHHRMLTLYLPLPLPLLPRLPHSSLPINKHTPPLPSPSTVPPYSRILKLPKGKLHSFFIEAPWLQPYCRDP